jgi:hypothetical protein
VDHLDGSCSPPRATPKPTGAGCGCGGQIRMMALSANFTLVFQTLRAQFG